MMISIYPISLFHPVHGSLSQLSPSEGEGESAPPAASWPSDGAVTAAASGPLTAGAGRCRKDVHTDMEAKNMAEKRTRTS